jgi:hypothetical protein
MEHHKDIRDRFVDVTIEHFAIICNDLKTALYSGVLEYDLLANNNLYRFNKAHRDFKAIHSYRYMALRNYKDAEIFLFQIISKIYSEHRISASPPIVSTISNQDDYYWAHPFFELIALPVGEEKCLLNLPDLFHEIGHFLHSMFQGKSCELSRNYINEHFKREIVRVIDEGNEKHFKPLLENVNYFWLASWIEEFSCDLVGTYMTGASYAWTNLKLLSTGHGSAKIYECSQTHPADESRMRIIIKMLEKLELNEELDKVKAVWKVFLEDTESFKPVDYQLYYPDSILDYIIEEFYSFYQDADLATYSELKKYGNDSIALILNDAWTHAQTDPNNYNLYEKNTIDKLMSKFGLK